MNQSSKNLGKGRTMNREPFKGQWSQFKGELKKQWGKFINDHLVQTEGEYDKFTGSVEERYGDKKGEVSGRVEK